MCTARAASHCERGGPHIACGAATRPHRTHNGMADACSDVRSAERRKQALLAHAKRERI